jgi:hypothetical protein
MKIVSLEKAENLPSGRQLLDSLPRGILLEELNVRYLDGRDRQDKNECHRWDYRGKRRRSGIIREFKRRQKRCFFNKKELAKMDIRGVSYIKR